MINAWRDGLPDVSRDDDTGRYSPKTNDTELVSYVNEHGPVGTQDVALAFGYSRSSMYRRLRKLEYEDKITSTMIGGSKVWDGTA